MSRQKIRGKIPQKVVDDLMFRNRHMCCICRKSEKHVQIHHIDGNSSNNTIGNLAVLCLGCHSRATSDEGLGRRYSPGEVRKYKREWESLSAGKLVKPNAVARKLQEELLRAEIQRLMVQAIALKNVESQLEALEQLETYYIYLGQREAVLDAIHSILMGSVWGERKLTAACAEILHHLFWGLPGPEHVAINHEDEDDLATAIGSLEWIAENATVYMRSVLVQRSLCDSIFNLYLVAADYSRSRIGLKLIQVLRQNLTSCESEEEFAGIWWKGIRITLNTLGSMLEETPSRWKKAEKAISELHSEYSKRTTERT